MSLAATTNSTLTVIGSSSFKSNVATTSDTKHFPLATQPIAIAWSPDNSILFIASANTIHAFSPPSGQLTLIHTVTPDTPLDAVLAARDASTVVFTVNNTPQILSTSSRPPQIIASPPAHATQVTSISLSNDTTLLASTSVAGVLHVYSLANNSNSVLRSFPAAARARCVCAFDPHSQTRLYVGAGTTLAIYDTKKGGSPVKTISLVEKGTPTRVGQGHVVGISVSPYSKTLVIVGCSASVVIIDLEKGVVKIIPVKARVTCITFTADGSCAAIGTDNGKVLLQDLRNTERPRRVFEASNQGDPVISVCIQKKLRLPEKGKSPARRVTPARVDTAIGGGGGGASDRSRSSVNLAVPSQSMRGARARISSGSSELSVDKENLPLQLSPLRQAGNIAPHELLTTVIQDVMYDYRQETRAEIKGLHLDLLKVGRTWKNELREIMEEYVGDLKDLREENARLRAENDRLRRGY